MNIEFRVVTLMLLVLLTCPLAAECTGNGRVSGNVAERFSTGDAMGAGWGPLYDFIGVTGCTHKVFGPSAPTHCFAETYYAPNHTTYFGGLEPAHFVANIGVIFASTGSNSTANGCTFTCPGGTCKVRGGDALPVELMGFSVTTGIETGHEEQGDSSVD